MRLNAKRCLLLILVLVLSIFCLASCGGGKDTITGIFISKSDMPRTTFVEGQALDLSGGFLSVEMGGKTSPLPLSDGEISVSGYDSTKTGQQTLTLSYRGFTTTLTVTVIPRMAAESFDRNYFTNDKINTSAGRLKIARDNGTTYYVPLNDSRVSLNYDFSEAGNRSVAVTFTDGGASYNTTFNVTVHTPASISFTPPRASNQKYESHDTTLNLSGGYFTVKAASPSTFEKQIPLTDPTVVISGFSPSSVGFEDRKTPVTQTVTVRYGDAEHSFTVQVSFSSAHFMSYVAERIGNLDWSDSIPDFDDDIASLAAEALEGYIDAPYAVRELVSEEDTLSVARCAVIYLNNKYVSEANKISDAISFRIDESRRLIISPVGKSYAATAAAVTVLNNSNSEFNVAAKVLGEAEKEFQGKVLYGAMTFDTYIIAHDQSVVDAYAPMLAHMLDVYDAIAGIESGWTLDTLRENSMAIEEAANIMLGSDYRGAGFAEMFYMISSWRADDDYLDIIYTYFFSVKENGKGEIISRIWNSGAGIPLPGALGEWDSTYSLAYSSLEQFSGESGMLLDTSAFMYYYKLTLESAEAVKNSDNDLYVGIFELVNGDGRSNYLYANGYMSLLGSTIGDSKIEHIWDIYLTLIDVYITDTNSIVNRHADFSDLIESIATLSPAEINLLISTLNNGYNVSGGNYAVFYPSTTQPASVLSYVLGLYYTPVIGEDGLATLASLMKAMERFSLLNVNELALNHFVYEFESLESQLKTLSAAKRDTFHEHFGDIYTTYLTLYNCVTGVKTEITPSEEASALLDELYTMLFGFNDVITYISSPEHSDDERNMALPILFALAERAAVLHSEIVALGGEGAIALYAEHYKMGEINVTLDYLYKMAKQNVFAMLASQGDETTGKNLFDVYREAEISPFLSMIARLLLSEHNGIVYGDDNIGEIMAAFRALSANGRLTFYKLMINLVYYNAIERAFSDALSHDIIAAILETEIAYVLYENDNNETYLTAFETQLRRAKEMVDSLENTDSLGALYDMYQYYLNKYEAIN